MGGTEINNKRRKRLHKAQDEIVALISEIEDILNLEEKARDNIPDYFEERYERACEVCNTIDSIRDYLEEINQMIDDATE